VPSLGHVKDNPQNGEKESDKKMNKKILSSIMIIAFAVGLLGAGTMAYFNHVLQVGTVTFTAGTVEIALRDGESTQFPVTFLDMKPCYTRTLTFEIKNVGANPVDVYKHLYNFAFDEHGVTAAEGQYYTANDIKSPPGKNDIDTVILYDLWVEVYVPKDPNDLGQGYKLLWHQGIYDETVTIHDLECVWIYLGMLPVDAYMKVIQSYHMWEWTGNWAQSDTMTFDIEVKGEQLKGQLTLENKDTSPNSNYPDGKYLILYNDNNYGTLTYKVTWPKFEYSFTGKAKPSTDYVLIYYSDPWATQTGSTDIGQGTTTAAGDITISGNVDIGSLPKVDDANYPYGAKIWLVLKNDYDFVNHKLTGWHPADYLFETGLIIYTKG